MVGGTNPFWVRRLGLDSAKSTTNECFKAIMQDRGDDTPGSLDSISGTINIERHMRAMAMVWRQWSNKRPICHSWDMHALW